MSVEDRVRTATRAGAALVRDIGPMTAAPGKIRSRRRPAPTPRRWGSWGIPLVAAAAVVLVALSLVAVRQFGSTDRPANRPAPTAPAAVPRYYVALDGPEATGGSGGLIVGDDVTGKAVATVSPPPGLQFDSVRGASDDRTFVAMATSVRTLGSPPDTWYELRIAPGTAHPYQLSKLAIKLPGSAPGGLAYALSPDDRELAIESIATDAAPGGGNLPITLGIYSVSSGAELRAWTTATFRMGPAQSTLSWLPGGRRLAFSDLRVTGNVLSQELRTLDVTASGTDLVTASRALFAEPRGASTCYSLQLTPDGGTVLCAPQYAFITGGGTNGDCAAGGLNFTAYSIQTGKLVRVLYRYRGPCHNGLAAVPWTDASAAEIIAVVEADVANEGGQETAQVGVVTDGHLRLLKLATGVPVTDYLAVAF
jgi:hypothetical protein